MKLSTKLPLAFAAVLALMLAAALYGIANLNGSIRSYGTTVKAGTDHERAVNALTIAFKVQVQEWKNTLLRGRKSEELEKHWKAFGQSEAAVADVARQLVA